MSGAGRGCNTLTGRFIILEALYGPGGPVLRFAADYEQHCEGGGPALFGPVRNNSSVPFARVALAGATVYEGQTGSTSLNIPLSLAVANPMPVTIRFRTADGTAMRGSDYLGLSGSVVVPAGQTTAAIPIPVLGDRLAEPDETFYVAVTAGPYVAVGGQVAGTIPQRRLRGRARGE